MFLPAVPSEHRPPALLQVSNLSVCYGSANHGFALRDINFQVSAGEIIGVLGESGSGKSTLALSILGLLPAETQITGEILYGEANLLRLEEKELRPLRGAKISLIHQEPGLALSPVMRVGRQIDEVLRAHCNLDKKDRKREVARVLDEVRLHGSARIANSYPHQLSGGELHRVVIAQATVCHPELVIADEPTRALDVRTQAEILRLLLELNRNHGTAILFITHNPALLVEFASGILVMYAGQIVEAGDVSQVFRCPRHPYTRSLLQNVPQSLFGYSSRKMRDTSCFVYEH